MNPSTGTFISMDSYQGSIYDPGTLHKYLYANANPVMYTDPSGYFSIAESSIATSIQSTLNTMHQMKGLVKLVKWADAMCTVYDTAMEIRSVILGGGSVGDLMFTLIKGVAIGFMVDGMCKTSLGIVLKPMMAVFGLSDQVDQIQEAIKSKDSGEVAVRFTQLICMLFGLTSQCFTGDTLVSSQTGLRPIAEIQIGDYVWSEDTETGKKELKQVTAVSVTMTNTLVYVTTEDGTTINTTENHPFYVEGKGWCVAAELEIGDVCRTKEGQIEVVASVVIEQQEEPVKVYNLTVEDNHTYYVSMDEVLVHNNGCGENVPEPDLYHYTTKEGAHSIETNGIIRTDNRGRIFVTTDKIKAEDVNNSLFMGQKPDAGEYVIEIYLNDKNDYNLTTQGATQPNELIYHGSMRNGRNATLIVKENDF